MNLIQMLKIPPQAIVPIISVNQAKFASKIKLMTLKTLLIIILYLSKALKLSHAKFD
jgi:hypothetical protein